MIESALLLLNEAHDVAWWALVRLGKERQRRPLKAQECTSLLLASLIPFKRHGLAKSEILMGRPRSPGDTLKELRKAIVSRERSCARWLANLALAATCAASNPVCAEELSKEELAKLAQNPIANLISVPFQNNTNFNVGPQRGVQDILNIQPVVPFSVSSEWNIITRTIAPLIFNPTLGPNIGAVNGLGDVQLSGFLSPAAPSDWIWGVGAITQFPTHTSPTLGNDNLGVGPTAVVLHLSHGDPWVYGALANNVWSTGTSPTAPAYSNGLLQPFINYNFKDGLYLASGPIITMNWLAPANQQLTLPVGGGIGKIFHIGKLPVNSSLTAYYNVVRPDGVADWQLRLTVQFMFPK